LPNAAIIAYGARPMKHALAAMLALTAACGRSESDHPYRATIDLTTEIRALGSDDLFESDPAEAKIVALGPAALPALGLALEREPPAVRAGVVGALARLHTPETAPLLVTAAHDPAEEVRSAAVDALGGLADPRGQGVVEAALHDPGARVRLFAARACAALCSSPAALARLVEIALDDESLPASSWARASLRELLGRDAAARAAAGRAAKARLPEANPVEARARAALLLADLGDPAGAEALAVAAQHTTTLQLRLQAIYALGVVGDEASVPALAELLADANPSVPVYAYDALGKLDARGVASAATARQAYRGEIPTHPLPRPGA